VIAPKVVEYVFHPDPFRGLKTVSLKTIYWHKWRNRFSKEYKDVRFYKFDVDEVPDLAQELGIRAMPTFILFKDGDKVDEVVGANPKAIEAAIKKHM
jgi:thioredoxin-related protein